MWRALRRQAPRLAAAQHQVRLANTSAATALPKPQKIGFSLGDRLAKKGPRKDVKMLPDNPNMLRINVKSIVGMTPAEIALFAGLLNQHGAAVLVPDEDTDDGRAAYRMLDRLLGTCVDHDQMNEFGVVEINPARPTSINTANPQKPHLPHTDDAYTEQPSRFITLQCRQAAPSGGGESVLVSGADLLAVLNSEELRALMRPGMVTMGRRPAADASWMKVSSIPMFWVNKESGWLQLRWRCNDGCVQDIDQQAESAYQRMDEVARGKAKQLVVSLAPQDILVVDNRAIAHGRRPFEGKEPRVMWRRNYVGDGELAHAMSVGLCQAYSSVFEQCSSVFDPM
eukprot:gnl/TRDRNA2_/TRDRNA2_134057_c0_seq1.p1 gnl/TRDRNA2_/TRDRNA2_134057_c0~~gnl/TRDRNA2_/TRDRNA2_134057_c0_seq1.p1  ORF type:complete len:340 (+),score=57.74 gnl/TRDRNA2_/TRDRNA2_134057_c0_seq1:121-1140(+)